MLLDELAHVASVGLTGVGVFTGGAAPFKPPLLQARIPAHGLTAGL